MNAKKIVLAAGLTILMGAAQAQQAIQTPVDDEGLSPLSVKGLDHVYARPGVNLGQYSKVMLDPVEVSFSKNWTPDRAGGPITAAER